jgi:hypothetical protein
MRNGLLRVMDIPEKVGGHGKVNLREEALKIAEGLFKYKERENLPFPAGVDSAVKKLAPNPNCAGTKYYDEMMKVYDDVWMMISEIMECQDLNPIYELIKNIEDYMNEAEKQKKCSLSKEKK